MQTIITVFNQRKEGVVGIGPFILIPIFYFWVVMGIYAFMSKTQVSL